MSKYETRLNRIKTAVALQESDRVPINSVNQCYPILEAGHTVAEAVYDFNIVTESYLRFAKKYDADAIFGHAYLHGGMGPIFELIEPKTVRWAGMPGNIIDKNSIHQFIEFPLIEESEFDQFATDRTGWLFDKGLAKVSKLLEPVANWRLSAQGPFYATAAMIAGIFSNPETKKMLAAFDKITELNNKVNAAAADLDARLEKEAEIPVLAKGMAGVPFDGYSDFYRGTLDAMADLYEHEDVINQFRRQSLESNLAMVKMQGQFIPGKWIFMALHKGMDGFLSAEQYRKYYWDDLRTIINCIIDNGMTPYIYTEGSYTSRLECLKEVPRGKVIYHFEQCDMAKAKKVLGDTACISGGFPVNLLAFGTKQQVIDEVKRLIDTCAGGGGYIFETGSGYDEVKQENVEAMYETAQNYGKK
jgi:uroporphyrinogen-III decarboxylase